MLLDADFADALGAVFEAAADEGIGIIINSAYRSTAKQQALYNAYLKRGRTGLPAAPPGSSFHEYGLAIDIATDPPNALRRVGEIAEAFGLRWGGRFGDPVHIDAGNDFSLSQAKAQFRVGNLMEV